MSSTSGADRTGHPVERDGRPPGPVPAARTTTGTGCGGGEAVDPGGGPRTGTGTVAGPGTEAGPVLPGQRPYDFTLLRLPELRALRRDSQRDEADLSYLRRLLQGRIDILRDELSRRTERPERTERTERTEQTERLERSGPEPVPGRNSAPLAGPGPEAPAAGHAPRGGPATASMVVRLAEILSDAPSRHRTSARHVTLSTPRGAECRRLAAETLAEVELSDLAARTDEELHAAMRRFVRNEQQISRRRHQLQRTVDGCSAEIARRYREGEAQVDDLLT